MELFLIYFYFLNASPCSHQMQGPGGSPLPASHRACINAVFLKKESWQRPGHKMPAIEAVGFLKFLGVTLTEATL